MGVLRLILSTLSNYGRQCAFAIAPVPAYLPQYWTLCNTNDPLLLQRRAQLSLLQPGASTSNNAGSNNSVGSSSNADLNVNSLPSSPVKDANLGMSSEAGGDMDRDHGTNVNTNSHIGSGTNSDSAEGGFSSTSIMILLLSHVFRLQYFFVSAIVSTFYDDENDNENNNNNNNNNNNAKNAMNNNHNNNDNTNTRKVDHVHFDLVMQSIVMIGIQLLLLSAVTRRKRMSHKKKVDDDFQYDDDHVFDDHHGDHNNTRIYDDHVYDVMMDGNSSSSNMSTVKSKSKGRFSSLSKSALSKLSLSNSNSKSTISKLKPSKSSKSKTKSSSSSSTSSLSQKPFIWLLKPNQNNWKWDTVHQHIELLILLTILEYIICRYYIHPNNTMNYITTVKNISVLLESCLALPQMILNYKRKSTVGLSLLMVIGWVLGDLLKLAYFISAYHNGNGNDHEGLSGMNANVGASASASAIVSGVGSNGLGNAGSFDGSAVATPHREESSSDMVAFMIGCLFALGLDSIVMLQLIRWYPTKMTNNVMRKFQNGSLMRLLICKDWNWNCNWNCNNSKSKSKHKSKNIIKNMNMNSRNDGVTSTMKKKRFLGSRPMEELMP